MAAREDGLYARVPPSPPVVEMTGGGVGHLLCWELHERDASWHAWVSWVQTTGHPARHRHRVVSVRADAVRQLENPEAYKNVPRRTLGRDGRIRPWTPPGGRSPPGSPRAYPKPELLAAALSGQ